MSHVNAFLDDYNNQALVDLYGADQQVLKNQAAAYKVLVQQFQDAFGHDEVALFSSPGRTEIGGNHTDHNHGRVLAGAVDMDNIAVASANNSKLVRIQSSGYLPFEIDISSLEVDPTEKYTSMALIRGVMARMNELGYAIGGFDACINGRVPKGSGLSSSASFEVLIGTIVGHLFNDGKLAPILNARIGQYAENVYFGKPCGLMDQTACAVGGFITIDFEHPDNPVVKKLDFDFKSTGFSLVITDTGGDHAHLSEEYATLPTEMKAVASELGAHVLREVSIGDIIAKLPAIRKKTGDRALLRAIHFQGDNLRVARQVEALESDQFQAFLDMVKESGYSSFMYNQNIHASNHVTDQSVALGLALSHLVLDGKGAWRVHGGGFAGTIQAFVPNKVLTEYINTLEHAFGKGACLKLAIREKGACKVEIGY